jgi:PAS domain S-box-containing protein
METGITSSPSPSSGTWENERQIRDFQRATLNILEDSELERKRLEIMQTATLNILEDFAEERSRFTQVQTATLNILEDFAEEKFRYAQVQTATLNILEDFDEEKQRLQQSQRAFLNILEDIDLEKEKVAGAFRQIEAVNKELQEFAYAASHDLKAPLRVIDNASKWLEEDLQQHLTDETRENMNLLRGRIKRMERLLDDLLEYSRIGRITDDRFAEIISGDVLMENILTLLSPPKGFSVRVDGAVSGIRVRRMPLQQILMNLISNAIKHHHKKAGTVEVTVGEDGANHVFAIKDDGPGIAPHDDEGDRKQVRRALKQFGLLYECTETASIAEALAACADCAFDCVIVDYRMPGNNGLRGIAALHERYPYISIIMATGDGDEAVATEAMKNGASDYISKKHIRAETIGNIIESAVAKTALRQRTARQREEQLRQSAEREQLLIAAVASSNDAIITKTPEGVITGWNRAAEILFGFRTEEAIGQSIDIIVPIDLRSEVHRNADRIQRGERSITVKRFALARKDGASMSH